MKLSATWIRDKRGAAAVEFALVSLIFILVILFVLTVGLYIFFGLSLDFAASKAARQVMTGKAQSSGFGQSQFVTNYVCPYLPYGMNCADVIVNVYTVTEAAQPGGYYTYVNSGATALNVPALSNGSASYSLGAAQSYEYLEIVYPVTFMPSSFTSFFGGGATYNGSPAFLLVSTAAFKNEAF